jgi:hypothetical protein
VTRQCIDGVGQASACGGPESARWARIRAWPLALATLIFLSSAAFAQQKAQISGIVQDPSGASIPGASVVLLHTDTGIRRVATTNNDGFYAVSSLAPGAYKITVRREGFQTIVRVGFPLQATEAAVIDFTLQLGSMHEEITVEGAPELINTVDGSSGIVIRHDLAASIPVNGRGIQGLLELAPGVVQTPATAGEAGQFSANGQRPNANYFTVDGVSANNGVSGSGLPGMFSGAALPAMSAIGSLHTLASLGELQELRVQTSTFAPEYGRMPGAQVSVTTRSGSNTFHGSAFGIVRNEKLNAADWFTNSAGLERAKHRLHDFGGTLGGPLRRNSTFFFLAAERLELHNSVAFRLAVPNLAVRQSTIPFVRRVLEAFPVPNGPALDAQTASFTAVTTTPSRVATTSVRIDQALGSAGLLFVRYHRAPSSSRYGYLQLNDGDFRSQGVTVAVVTAITPTISNDARVNTARTRVRSIWSPNTADGQRPLDFTTVLPNPGEGQKLYGVDVHGIGQLMIGDAGEARQTQWNLIDAVAVSRGTHDIRFGIDYQRLSPTRENTISSVVGTFESMRSLVSGDPPAVTFAQAAGGSSTLETFSAFAQDSWRVAPRFTLTYGLRWEWTPPPSYRTLTGPITLGGSTTLPVTPPGITNAGQPITFRDTPAWPSRHRQFAPRLGMAWRLDAEGRFVLRAGAGLFYDLGFSSATDLINGAPYNRWGSTSVPTTGTIAPLSTVRYGFAPDLRMPYSWEWNVTLERALTNADVVSAAWVGSAGRHLLRREGYLSSVTNLPEIVIATNNGRSDYHALQLQYRRRMARGLGGVVSYAWSHSIDNGSWDSASFLVASGGSARQDRGSSNFDVRHALQAALSYDLPWKLTISSFLRARSGFPVDVVSEYNAFGLGFDNVTRPDLVPGVPIWIRDSSAAGGRRLNAAAFRLPASGQGSLGRNSITGHELTQLDVALQRRFTFGERTSLDFRVEAYNVTNHPTFADPVRYLSHPYFGTSTSLANLMLGAGRPSNGLTPAFQPAGPRVVQLGVYLRF